MTSDRRNFLKRATLAAAATTAAGALSATAMDLAAQQGAPAKPPTPTPVPRALDAALLAAVADAVLPESLGADGRTRATAAFGRWLAGYQPVVEEMHGYGDAEITFTPSDPAPGWQSQLAGLDLLARRKHRRGFARLGVPLRREVLRAQLDRVAGTRLPSSPLAAPHVAVALLAHWAMSSEATDLAYGARILKGNCRPLAESPQRPLPLSGADA